MRSALPKRRRTTLALMAAALLVLPACGQFEGVHDDFVAQGGENPGHNCYT